MSCSSPTPALCLRAALQGGIANARPESGAGIAALILALLLRLFGRTEAAWIIAPHARANATPQPNIFTHALIMPTIGRAPHAAVIEAGLVPDWILPGIRNRGMRPAAIRSRPHRRTRPARAPPVRRPRSALKPPPTRGRRITPKIVCNSK